MKKFALFLGIIALDQFTKQFALAGLLPSLGGLFVEPFCNPFIAWSIPIEGVVFYALWLGIVSVFIYLLERTVWNVFLLITLAGAASNLIDRLRHGCIVDFIQIGSFPLFNFADVFIVMGVTLFLLSLFFISKKRVL